MIEGTPTMTTIAVTGATGNLGGLVIDRLLALGVPAADVVPLVRSPEKGERFAPRGMSPRVASYDDPDGFRQALAGVDRLVLISSPSLENVVRLRQLHGAVMAVYDAGVSQLAYVGLADPEEYAFGLEDVELATEHTIRAAGVPYTFLRNSVYLDELAPELHVALASGELLSITGDQTLNWAPRADQAAAIAASVLDERHVGKTYNLVGPQRYTYADIAAMLSEATGTNITYRCAPAEDVILALTAGGMDAEHARGMVTVFQQAIASGKWPTTGNDIERLSGHTGRVTVASIADLVERDGRG